jgi:protein TonB
MLLTLSLCLILQGPPATAAQPPQPPVIEATTEKPWPPPDVVRAGNGVAHPRLIKETKPNYTGEAMRQRIEGVVWMEAIVEADGSVGEVRVTQSLDKEYVLDEEAVRAVKQWRFAPAMQEGEPVRVLVEVQMSFVVRK